MFYLINSLFTVDFHNNIFKIKLHRLTENLSSKGKGKSNERRSDNPISLKIIITDYHSTAFLNIKRINSDKKHFFAITCQVRDFWQAICNVKTKTLKAILF